MPLKSDKSATNKGTVGESKSVPLTIPGEKSFEHPETSHEPDFSVPDQVLPPEPVDNSDSSETPFATAESQTTGKSDHGPGGNHPIIDPMTGQVMSVDEYHELLDSRK